MHVCPRDEIVPGNPAIVICGDDERGLVDTPKIAKNVDKMKAMAAAVGGTTVFSIFPKDADSRLSDFNAWRPKPDSASKG